MANEDTLAVIHRQSKSLLQVDESILEALVEGKGDVFLFELEDHTVVVPLHALVPLHELVVDCELDFLEWICALYLSNGNLNRVHFANLEHFSQERACSELTILDSFKRLSFENKLLDPHEDITRGSRWLQFFKIAWTQIHMAGHGVLVAGELSGRESECLAGLKHFLVGQL